MRRRFTLVLFAISVVGSSAVFHGQAPVAQQDAGTERVGSVEDVIARINKSEAALVARMRVYRPLIEVYIQDFASDPKLSGVPTKDYYFLGQFQWQDGPKMEGLNRVKNNFKGPGFMKRPLGVQYLPDGFASMTAPDWNLLDPKRYEFKFVRREFLGEARCLVFDVHPLEGVREGFFGRIWVEDRDFNIVRFNGINRGVDTTLSGFFRKKLSFHVDSWRVNVLPGQWLPSYVYCEEADADDSAAQPHRPRIKSQVRIWNYQAKIVQKEQQFTDILIDEPSVRDSTEATKQLSPVESQRRWELEAEENIIDRLSKSGFLAPIGDVDKILETVVNNLVVTNTLTLDAPVRCRVLLTSPLESFTVGHTIVLSRGLIDVLPDEASLAMMLAHELSHVVLGHPLIDTKFAFADRLMISDAELLDQLQFHHEPGKESEADATVIELLKKSPYKDKLEGAGLFLRAIAGSAKQLPNLIQPHFGEHIADNKQVLRLGDLMRQAPALAPESLEQIPALPLGGRLLVDPWSGRVELLRTPSVALVSAREKVPFAITPLMPYIKYVDAPAPTAPGR